MIKNYFKIAWRNLIRNKVLSVINIGGLSLGMTCCLLIFLWVKDERSIDNFHRDGENIYTAYVSRTSGGEIKSTYTTPMEYTGRNMVFLLEDIKQAVPEVKNVVFYATDTNCLGGMQKLFRWAKRKLRWRGHEPEKISLVYSAIRL